MKTFDDELQKMAHTKARKFKPRDSNPHSSTGGRCLLETEPGTDNEKKRKFLWGSRGKTKKWVVLS